MTPDEVLSAIARMPSDLQRRRNVSMLQLLKESGYLQCPNAVTTSRLREYFGAHPDTVDAWIQNSEDNRGSPAWYVVGPDNSTGKGKWQVGYYPGSYREAFDSREEACATYVLHWLKQTAAYA